MGLTTFDVSATTQRDMDQAARAYDQSGEWRDFRRVARLAAEPVHNLYGRPNGTGVVPSLVTHPNLDDDPIALANLRTIERNLPDGTLDECRVAHWATPCVYYSFALTEANCRYLAECRDALADYPVLDERDWCEVEGEMRDDEWENGGARSDIVRTFDDKWADRLDELETLHPEIANDIWAAGREAWDDEWQSDHWPTEAAAEAMTERAETWHGIHAWMVYTCGGRTDQLPFAE